MMRQVELNASLGGFVAVVEILPVDDPALFDVVMWGIRTFRLARDGSGDPVFVNGRPLYIECFAGVSLTPSPGLPR